METTNENIEEQIIEDFARAWRTMDASLIIKHLSPKFVYDSQWVFESLNCEKYKEYITHKFENIKRTGAFPDVKVVDDPHCASVANKMIALNQNGNVCCYRIKVEDEKVVKGDMCML